MNTFIVDFMDPDTYQSKEGVLVAQHYEPVTDRWVLLLAGKDGKMYSITHTSIDARISWISSDAVLISEDDDEDDDDSEVGYE